MEASFGCVEEEEGAVVRERNAMGIRWSRCWRVRLKTAFQLLNGRDVDWVIIVADSPLLSKLSISFSFFLRGRKETLKSLRGTHHFWWDPLITDMGKLSATVAIGLAVIDSRMEEFCCGSKSWQYY